MGGSECCIQSVIKYGGVLWDECYHGVQNEMLPVAMSLREAYVSLLINVFVNVGLAVDTFASEPALFSLVKLASIPLQQSPTVHSQPRLIGIVRQCQRLDWLDPLLFGMYKMRHYEVECCLDNLA